MNNSVCKLFLFWFYNPGMTDKFYQLCLQIMVYRFSKQEEIKVLVSFPKETWSNMNQQFYYSICNQADVHKPCWTFKNV